jgi:hypothetical protein
VRRDEEAHPLRGQEQEETQNCVTLLMNIVEDDFADCLNLLFLTADVDSETALFEARSSLSITPLPRRRPTIQRHSICLRRPHTCHVELASETYLPLVTRFIGAAVQFWDWVPFAGAVWVGSSSDRAVEWHFMSQDDPPKLQWPEIYTIVCIVAANSEAEAFPIGRGSGQKAST